MKKYFFIVIAAFGAFLFIPRAHAAITFDASSTKAFTAVTTVTSTITVGSGSNEALVIVFANSTAPSGVTVDGHAATLAEATGTGASIYYYLGLSSGSHNVSSSFSINANGGMGMESFFGVNQSTPLDTTSTKGTSSASPSSTITTTVANDWVIDATEYGTTRTSTAFGASQTEIIKDVGTTRALTSSYRSTTAAGAYVTSYTLSGSIAWIEVQAAFEPAGGVPGTPGTPTYTNNNATSTVTVNWTSATGATYYTVERATSSQAYAQITTTTATSYADSGLTANTSFYYEVFATNGSGNGSTSATSSVLTLPDVPGTPTYTSVATSTVTVNWTAPTYGATYYLLERATSSQSYAQIGTTTATSYGDTGLATSTTYFYEVQGVNTTGGGAFSATSSVTTTSGVSNSPPNAPNLISPASGVQDALTTTVFTMTSTDPNADNVQYEINLYTTASCAGSATTYSENSSQTGWSGQNASSSQEYTSGSTGTYTTQSALSQNTTYYWNAQAIDPEGSNTWSATSSCSNFTTTFGNWTTDSGNWSISGSDLTVTPSSGSSVQLHVTGSSQTSGVVEFSAESSAVGAGTGSVAGIARADTGANRYLVSVGNFLNQQNVIGKTISSAYTSLTNTAFTFSTNTFYHFRGWLSGTNLESWVNGANIASTTDSSLSSAGFIGLQASSSNGSAVFTFNDFAWYTTTTITMSNLPGGGSWSVLNHAGTVLACQTGNTWNLATYNGQVPIDYNNGGGTVAVWASSASCSGSSTQVYPSAGYATDIFGGDTYSYTATVPGSGSAGGTTIATTTITVNPVGAVSY